MTPTNPPQYSISEVLDTLLGEWGASPAFETDQIKKAEQAINQLIYTQVLELIGEDELGIIGVGFKQVNEAKQVRDVFRAMLRAKAKAKFMGKE